jgi:teichuronic acid exporter
VEFTGLVIMPIAFWIGSHWGLKGIALGWIYAYPIVALSLYWKAFKTLEMKVSDYLKALRPALDGTAAMIVAIVVFHRFVRSALRPWPYLLSEIGIGAAVYAAVLILLHRDRLTHFRNVVRRMAK